MNVVLIGMPGAGKSTVGVVLAKALAKNYIDTDIVIQQQEGNKLHEIIDNRGLEYFLKVEEMHIINLTIEDCVIATGGSVVYSSHAMEYLKSIATVIYLKLNYEEIERRLKDITTRGIAMEKGVSLRDLYIERIPLYEKYADTTIHCDGKKVEEIIEEIVRLC